MAIPSYAAGWQWMDPNGDRISEWAEVLTGTDHGQATKQIAASMGVNQYGIYNWMLSVSR